MIPINFAVEDLLSEAILREIIVQSGCSYKIGRCYMKHGKAYLKRTIEGFNNAAKGTPFLVLTDLDEDADCPPELIREWLSVPKHHNLLFRIAVREVESWLLADRKGIAKYLNIKRELVPNNVDDIEDTKQYLINLARKSRTRLLREDIVPLPGSTAKQGRNYNGCLISFVNDHWDLNLAIQNSPSLQRTVKTLIEFQPQW